VVVVAPLLPEACEAATAPSPGTTHLMSVILNYLTCRRTHDPGGLAAAPIAMTIAATQFTLDRNYRKQYS
jgi:hypothetical protein